MSTKKCLAFKKTPSGLRCSRYAGELAGPEHAVVSFPDLGDYGIMNYEVNSTDVIVGAGIGLLGVGAAKMINAKLLTDAAGISKLPGFLVPMMPLLGGLLGGTAAFMFQKNSNPNRGKGHMVGAIGAGAAVTAMDYLRTSESTKEYFADVVSLPFGVITRDPNRRLGRYGVITRDPAQLQARNMAALGRMSMSDSDMSDLEELMAS